MKKGTASILFLVLCPIPALFCGCNEFKTIRYNLKVTQSGPDTLYEARLNGLGHWDGLECSDCDMVSVRDKGGYKVWTCDFNLGLRKVAPKSGDPLYEMELAHEGPPFPVPDDQVSLVFIVDGQDLSFTQNSDSDGVFYDVTPDQLQAIIQGAAVVVRFIGLQGTVEKCFTRRNQAFFQKFLTDPTVTGTPIPTPTPYAPHWDVPPGGNIPLDAH